jgi:hypothetical protein
MEDTMKGKTIMILILAALFVFGFSDKIYAETASEQAAASASKMWLNLVDEGRYLESWDEASELFKEMVTREQWQVTIKIARGPYGNVVSRTLKSTQYANSLPGAPDGEYVVVQYETSFENKKSSIETVTPKLDKDGDWRVSGYYIK